VVAELTDCSGSSVKRAQQFHALFLAICTRYQQIHIIARASIVSQYSRSEQTEQREHTTAKRCQKTPESRRHNVARVRTACSCCCCCSCCRRRIQSKTMTWLPLNLSTEARQNCCSYLSVVFFAYILVGLAYVFIGAFVQQSIMSFGSVVYERYSSAYPDFMIAVGILIIVVHLFGTKVKF